MDDRKDIQKTSSIAPFFEQGILRTNPFGENQSAHRAYRRAERVVAAIYLITGHIPDSEPLKRALRDESLSLFERILALRNTMRSKDSPHVAECRASLRKLISLVRVLSVAQLVSQQNAQALIEGVDELGNFIDASKSSHLSDNISIGREDLLDIGNVSVKDIKDIVSVKDTSSLKDVESIANNRPSRGQSSVRERSVLSVLGGAGEVGIKDIAASLPEYSEKMIQRELAALVALGRVKKEGAKRWSRYSIIL